MYQKLQLYVAVVIVCLIFSERVLAEDGATRSYPLHAGDILNVQVWGEPELNHEVLIAPDSTFSFPLIGSIAVAGRDADAVQREVSQRLSKYIPDANVTISLIRINGNVIYVLGQVNRPGQFPMPGPINVAQALSLAGGMTPYANADKIKILRPNEEGQVTLPFRYSDIVKGEELEQNVTLVSGDVILVP